MRHYRFLFLLILGCFSAGLQAQIEPIHFKWDSIASYPLQKGVNGAFIGLQNENLIVAGGANFPDTPAWEGGEKAWYSDINILQKKGNSFEWVEGINETLPIPLAYGASVSTPEGMLIIGGNNANGIYSNVYLLKWNPQTKDLVITEQPPLPVPLANMQATRIGEEVFVVGGQMEEGGPATNRFFSFKDGVWSELPPLPGPGRIQPVVISQNNGRTDVVYVFSGTHYDPNAADPNKFLSDAYEFNPLQDKWREKSAIPFNKTPGMENGYIGAAPAIELGDSHILIFGGAGGENQHWSERLEIQKEIQKLNQLDLTQEEIVQKTDSLQLLLTSKFKGTSFSPVIWAYHTVTDTWTDRGEIPGPTQVVTSAVRWGEDIIIPMGEISPGVRTSTVNKVDFRIEKSGFGWANYLSLGIYLALMVGIGWYFSRRNNSTSDYFLAGGRIPWWAAGLSIYGTMLSAITYLSQPALAFAFDWQAFIGYFTILMMAPIVIAFYLPFYRRLNIVTAYEYLEKRFNIVIRIFGSASFVLFQLARMGIVVYLPALALTTVIGIDIYMAILIMGVLTIIYTVAGGIEAVIWTDVVQVGVLLGGLILGILYIAFEIGDLGYIYEVAVTDNKLNLFDFRWSWTEVVTWSLFLGTFALNFAPYTTDQAVVQRYMTTANEKESRKSIWLNGIISIPAGLLIFTLGTFLYVYFKTNPEFITVGMQNDGVFPLFIANHLPPGVAGLIIAGIFSASMSSLDSSIHSVSTVVTVDYFQRFKRNFTEAEAMKVALWTTIVVGVLGTGVACLMAAFPIASLFFFFQEVVGLFGSALAGIFILGIFFKRANWIGTFIGAILSVLVLVVLKNYTPMNFYIYPLIAIPVCVIGGYLASLLIPVRDNNIKGLVYSRKAVETEE